MGNILDRLAESDAHNFEESKRALAAFDSRMLEAVEGFSRLMEGIGQAFGSSAGYDQHSLHLNKWLESQPGGAKEAVRFLEQATLIGQAKGPDAVFEARTALYKANSVVARIYLILRLRRDFLFGVSDLLKLRLISTLGYLRIQSESAAILAILGKEPAMALEWLDPDSGRNFYKKYQGRIVKKMRDLHLHDHYEQGSAMALHSRVLGVTPGILVGAKDASEESIDLTYQEIDDPRDLFLWFYIFLKAHTQVVGGVAEGLPEIDLKKPEVDEYVSMVAELGAKLRPLYVKNKNSDLAYILQSNA
jgi:hypothetical protein